MWVICAHWSRIENNLSGRKQKNKSRVCSYLSASTTERIAGHK